MKDIVQTSTGAAWRDVETIEEAKAIGEATKTAFGWFFEKEKVSGQRNRYFALGDDFTVIGCVPLTPPPYRGVPAHGLPLFVAHRNANPFPAHERDIAELAQAIGAEIAPCHYPYRGAGVDQTNEEEGDSPSPGA